MIISNLDIIRLAVQQFDHRFILRALRAVSSIRKKLASSDNGLGIISSVKEARNSANNERTSTLHTPKKLKPESGAMIPEEEVYIAVLEQVGIIYKADGEDR